MKDKALVKDIEPSLIKTLKESDLSHLSAEFVESLWDNLLENDVLKAIPVLGTIRGIYKLHIGIREFLFVKKLGKFLWAFQDIPIEERQKMLTDLESDDDYKHKVGEQLILLLDRMEDMRKPVLLARAFIAYAKGLIDVVQLQRISFGIDHVFTYNLSELRQYYLIETDNKVSHNPLESLVFQNLANCGFVELTAGLGGRIVTKKNELGKLLVLHVLQDEE